MKAMRILGVALLATLTGCAAYQHAANPVYPWPGSEFRPTVIPVIDNRSDAGALRSASGPSENNVLSTASQADSDGPVTLRAVLSRTEPDKTRPQRLLLRVDYAAARATVDRPRLSIALVIDRSASMAESRKLPYALAAARWVVDNMADGDTLAIIAFGDQATVLSAAGRVVNKPFLFHRLDEVSPLGSTNLSAGLLEGIAQLGGAGIVGQVKQVLLLTDGLANRGETNLASLRRIAERAQAQGIGISTMGVGTHFNESLLADLAAAGGGRYTYIKTADQIPSAFKDALRGLLLVIAQNMFVEVDVTGGAIGRMYGQVLDQPIRTYKRSVGDLRATESGFLLAELEPSDVGAGENVQVDVRLVFDDLQAGERVGRVVRVRPPHDGSKGQDQSVILVAAILDAVERADAALRGLDAERYGQARVLFERLHERAREHAIRTRDQQLLNQAFVLKHFMGELAVAEREGLFHGHREARDKLAKESHYLRYLLTHHRSQF